MKEKRCKRLKRISPVFKTAGTASLALVKNVYFYEIMRHDKKYIIRSLLNGMYLIKTKNHDDKPGYKMYSGNMVPEIFIPERIVDGLDRQSEFPLFKKDRKRILTLNLTSIRRMHGNHWIYKLYRDHMTSSQS